MPDVSDADREAADHVMQHTFGWGPESWRGDGHPALTAAYTRGRDGIAAAIAQGREEGRAETRANAAGM